jgi:hypothetical protein
MNDRDEQVRQRLIEQGVELITFSQYWYNDEGFPRPRQMKAWNSSGNEVKLDGGIEYSILSFLHHLLLPMQYGNDQKVFGWQVKNNCLQVSASNLEYANRYGYPEDFQNESEEWNAYREAVSKWGGHSDPNYEYALSENLQQMLEASRWSSESLNSQTQLEVFFQHEDEFVRSSLAANPNIPEGTLVQLGYDHSPFVRNSVRMNPAIPDWLNNVLGKQLE